MSNLLSKENVEQIKDKIREELNTAIKKEKYLDDQDAILINKFLNKIKREISSK